MKNITMKTIKSGNMKKTLFFFAAFLLLSFTGDSGRAVYQVPRALQSITSADLDLDGDMDIVTGHLVDGQHGNPAFSILDNENGNFTLIDSSQNFCGMQSNILAINIDNDMFPDLVTFYTDVFGKSSGVFIRIFYNYQGNFSNYQDFPVNSSRIHIYINYGDVNDDGHLDIILASNQDRWWGVLYNDGAGNLGEAEYFETPDYPPQQLGCADLDADGRDDVIIIGEYTDVYFSNPGWFELKRLETPYLTSSVYPTDFDNDGDIDMVNIGSGGYTYAVFFENLGAREFESHTDFSLPNTTNRNIVVDLNNDELPDMVFESVAGQNISICYNTGSFEMEDPVIIYNFPVYTSLSCFNSADYDRNGFNDLAFATNYYNQPSLLTILFNDGHGGFVEDPVTSVQRNETPLSSTHQFTCVPNPMKGYTTFSYDLPPNAHAEIRITNLQGNLITTLKPLRPGKATWNAGDEHVKPGLYVACLVVERKPAASLNIVVE